MSKKRTILSLNQRIEVLRRLGEAHCVEGLLPSQCSETRMARMPLVSKHTGLTSWPTLNTSICILCNTPAVICCNNFRFTNYSIHNYYNACIQYEFRWWCNSWVVVQGVLYLASPACQPIPLMSGHLSCRDTFAWSRGCPFVRGNSVTIYMLQQVCY